VRRRYSPRVLVSSLNTSVLRIVAPSVADGTLSANEQHVVLQREKIMAKGKTAKGERPGSKSAHGSAKASGASAKAPQATGKSKSTAKGSRTAGARNTSETEADKLLKADHRAVEALFAQFEQSTDSAEKQKLARQACRELIVHADLEETYFYPACREANVEASLLEEAQVEHDTAKVLIAEVLRLPADSPYYDAKVKVLSEYVKHHVGEEESSSDGIFAQARKSGLDMSALGQTLMARKQELMSALQRRAVGPSAPHSLEVGVDFGRTNTEENQAMAQRSNQNQERDEYGRFANDDDRYSRGTNGGQNRGGNGNGRGQSSGGRDRDEYGRFESNDDRRGYSGSGRYDDDRSRTSSRGQERDDYGRFGSDDDRGSRYRSSSGPDRDESGRFTSDDDDRSGRRSSGSGRDRDDDDDRGSRGRSAAGRERDDQGRFTSDDDDRGRRSSGGSRDDDDRGSRGRSSPGGRERDESGRFASDDDRRSGGGGRSSERGRGDDEGRGWFGDSRGHAEAARRGWEHRDGGDNEGSRSSRSSGNDGDDNRGWYGDSRGHSEAARRGWQNRGDR